MAGSKQTNGYNKDELNIAVIKNDVSYIRDDVSAIKAVLQTNYVTKDQFQPVKKIAYGAITFLVAIIITAFGYLISRGGH